MYNNCTNCSNKKVAVNVASKTDNINWCSWEKIKERKEKIVGGEKNICIRKISKVKKEGSVGLLIENFEIELNRFKKHV